MKADILLAEKSVCESVYRKEIGAGQLCVGKEKGIDACKGDSGGPLMYSMVVNKDVLWFQAGVISLGFNSPCGMYPALYTYTPRYLEWIYKTIQP